MIRRRLSTRVRTADNAANLAPSFIAEMRRRYGGTLLGRQELDGELIENVAGALWRADWIEATRAARPPPLQRIVVAVDPPVTATAVLRRLRHRRRRPRRGPARLRSRRSDAPGPRRPTCGPARRSPPTATSTPIASSPRSTRAATSSSAFSSRSMPSVPVSQGAGDARQVAARRAGRCALCRRPRCPRRHASRSWKARC